MYPCPVCQATFDARKLLDIHLSTSHPDVTAPYGCTECAVVFASEKAAKQHYKKKHTTTHDEPFSGGNKRACVNDCPFPGTLAEWVETRYNPSRRSLAEQLSASTVARVVAFVDAVRFEPTYTVSDLLALGDEGLFVDHLDSWLDVQVQTHSAQTVNNHVRYLWLYVQYQHARQTTPDVAVSLVEYVADLVADTQTAATRQSTTLSVLKLEDPFALVRLRETVVNALLREQVEYIHPYLRLVVEQEPRHTEEDLQFGVRLRNWLELAMRFTNIPCRIQCSRELCLPDSPELDYVSKLVQRDGQYARLINQDKSAASHQPLLLPLGRLLSAYMHAYLRYGRPPTAVHSRVFCTRRGATWARPSRDLKHYLEHTLGIDAHTLDPTGRFIHGSRAIMMAVLAVGVQFDQQKMHGFARLLRHSSTTNERFYSMWQQRALSNQSIDVFAQLVGLDVHTRAPTVYTPVCLREVPAAVASMVRHTMNGTPADLVPCYGTRSIGTQTGDHDHDHDHASGPSSQELDVAATIPACTTCGHFSLALYGPFGSMRRKKYAGRYYLACPTCHQTSDGRFDLTRCRWYPLGYVPVQKSNSNRPRNLDEIERFIARTTTHEPASTRPLS